MGVTLGKGANWLHGLKANPLVDKVQQPIFTLEKLQSLSFDENHALIPKNIIDNFNQEFEALLEKASIEANKKDQDISLFDAMKLYIPEEWNSSQKYFLFQRKLRFFENYIGANAEYLSAKYWDEESGEVRHGVVRDAYKNLIHEMVKPCHIKLNTVVQKISYANQVKISTNQGYFEADAVIVTVPLGVLKNNNIIFEPALPPTKLEAIQRLGMGNFDIIAMEFAKPFWPYDVGAMYISHSSVCSMFFNIGYFLNKPILLGYVGGDTALKMEKENDNAIIKKLMNAFEKFAKKDLDPPLKYFITRWGSDPWSLGAYSYLPIHATPHDRKLLAEPISNKVYFAGEATSMDHPATTHGAYLSGLRAAKQVL